MIKIHMLTFYILYQLDFGLCYFLLFFSGIHFLGGVLFLESAFSGDMIFFLGFVY